MSNQGYSLDTSALLDGLVRYYPEAHFPRLWREIDALIDGGRLVVSSEVHEELKFHEDVACDWVTARASRLVAGTDGIIEVEQGFRFETATRITVLRLGRNVGIFDRAGTTQQEGVHAITAGRPTKVAGIAEVPA